MARFTLYRPTSRSRFAAAVVTLLIECLIGVALLTGTSAVLHRATEDLKIFEVKPEMPKPERVAPLRAKSRRPDGAASPPNFRSRATEIVAPPPLIRLTLPSPVVAAPIAANDREATSGAADVFGPGTGAGGRGNGTGSGGTGDGEGDGGDETPPIWRKGRLKNSDYPRAAGESGVGGTVGVKYLVGVDGRVEDCRVTRSSGNADLDGTTCRLIQQRFRFEPSRDASERPIPAYIQENHSWAVQIEPSPDIR